MTMLKMLAALAFALLMTGCASVPMGDARQDSALKTFPAPRPGTAGIYIYRNETFGAAIKQAHGGDQLPTRYARLVRCCGACARARPG
jgi:starvation-inducible outer membrane lipoprotein